MGYSAEVVRRARARLAQAKEERESEYRQHLWNAYQTLPRLKEIDLELRRTMAQAAQAAFQQGTDGREAMEQIRDRNLSLQRERERLAAEYFEEGYLDDSPLCAVCGGSGYVGSAMCECLAELCRQEQKKEVSILAGSKDNFSQFRLDYYPDRADPNTGVNPRIVMEIVLKECRQYAYGFSEASGNLLLSGDTGLGKTFLSACIARVVTDKGYSVVYETASHLFHSLEQARFNASEDTRREAARFTSCDLLIVDDLGTEMPSQFVTAALYGLINDRLIARKSMIISTNLTNDDLTRRYSPQIASRLRGNFQRLGLVGEDIRVLKNRRGL